MSSLLIQSHRQPLPAPWLRLCMQSVRHWARLWSIEYRFIDDDIFRLLSPEIIDKTQGRPAMASDLARLKVLQQALDQGFDRVIWCDADLLIFAPDKLRLPSTQELAERFAVGREVWVQSSGTEAKDKLKTYVKVHNAFLVFDRGNSFLDFYADTAESLLRNCQGPVPEQFIGPKLLTALHNVIQCPVIESVGMLSPLVQQDLLTEKASGAALQAMTRRSTQALAAANLCFSLVNDDIDSNKEMERLIDRLLTHPDWMCNTGNELLR